MKKMINKPDDVVEEMLQGMVAAHPEYVKRVDGCDVVVRAGGSQGKVALVSGGGSGHEPAHGGYVGKGMLDAAVAGAMFTSPTPDQVYAVENSTWTTGRRGIAGTIFVHKIAGACAEEGGDLQAVKAVAEKVIANVRTMGMAIAPCTVPAAGKPSFELGEREVEIGMGIHGEPGTHREEIRTVSETTDTLLDKIFAEGIYHEGDEVAVMVNGLGGTPLQELYLANLRVSQVLAEKKIIVAKTLVGNFMTSIDMAGYSVSLLKLDDELKKYLAAPADTPAFVQA